MTAINCTTCGTLTKRHCARCPWYRCTPCGWTYDLDKGVRVNDDGQREALGAPPVAPDYDGA